MFAHYSLNLLHARASTRSRSGAALMTKPVLFLASLLPAATFADNTHTATVNGSRGTTPNQTVSGQYGGSVTPFQLTPAAGSMSAQTVEATGPGGSTPTFQLYPSGGVISTVTGTGSGYAQGETPAVTLQRYGQLVNGITATATGQANGSLIITFSGNAGDDSAVDITVAAGAPHYATSSFTGQGSGYDTSETPVVTVTKPSQATITTTATVAGDGTLSFTLPATDETGTHTVSAANGTYFQIPAANDKGSGYLENEIPGVVITRSGVPVGGVAGAAAGGSDGKVDMGFSGNAGSATPVDVSVSPGGLALPQTTLSGIGSGYSANEAVPTVTITGSDKGTLAATTSINGNGTLDLAFTGNPSGTGSITAAIADGVMQAPANLSGVGSGFNDVAPAPSISITGADAGTLGATVVVNGNGTLDVSFFGTPDGNGTLTVAFMQVVDDAPTVLNPLADVVTTEDASNFIISLADVFDDEDNNNSLITTTASSSDPSLVTLSIAGDYLTLDFQPDQNGSATVTVTGTSNGLVVADSFDVNVAGVNDAPVFAGGSTFTTAENNASASFLVGATDADGDALTYTKTGPDADKFTLNVNTGELTWNAAPDYEANASAAGNNVYSVSVTVSDGTVSATQAVAINVTDLTSEDSDGDGLTDQQEMDGYSFFERIAGSFTWSQAKSDAESRGGHLATITSAAENAKVVAVANHGDWLGAWDAVQEGQWQWVTGESWGYANWKSGQPDNSSNEDYLHIYTSNADFGKWNDIQGHVPNGYVLEKTITTNPQLADSDGDGFIDSLESSLGSNASDRNSSPLDLGLVAHYRFDETSGSTAADSSGNGYDAILYNASNGPSTWVEGKVNGGIQLDGANDYLAIKNLNYTQAGQIPAVTIAAWIKTAASTGRKRIISFDRSEVWHFAVGVDSNPGKLHLATTDSRGSSSGTSDGYGQTVVSDNAWHLVAVSYDSATSLKKFYVDGVLDGSSSVHGNRALGSGTSRFGTIGAGNEDAAFNQHSSGSRGGFFNGALDEIRIYDRALTDVEIAALYQMENTPPASQYTLSLTADAGGSVTGDGNYSADANASIIATPDVGYHFTSWAGSGIADPSAATTTVLMDQNHSVTANFAINQYALTATGGAGGSASGAGTYSHDANASITAIPDVGHHFTHWTGSGIADPNAATTTVLMDQNRSVTAHFAVTNQPPTDLHLSSLTILENQPIGAIVGEFNATDLNDLTGTGSYTYTLVAGEGADWNSEYAIDANGTLVTGVTYDFEGENSDGDPTLGIRVQVTDDHNATFSKAFVLTVLDDNDEDVDQDGLTEGQEEALGTSDLNSDTDGDGFPDADEVAEGSDPTSTESRPNWAPTGISLTPRTILENQPEGTLVGVFSTEDPDHNDTHVYALVDGSGSQDNSSFQIAGNALYALENFDFETKSSYNIRVRSTDAKGLKKRKSFTVQVLDAFIPGVETLAATKVKAASARLRGSLLDDGGLDLLEGGFVLSRSPDPERGKAGVTTFPGEPSGQGGFFIHKATGLSSGVNYYYRAYAGNAEGISYGEQVKFRTATSSDGPLSNAAIMPDSPNWRESPWFGSFFRANENWIYHADFGWLYLSGDDTDSIWVWSQSLGWLWTSKNVYPYLYRPQESDWYLFMKNVPGRTILFRYATGQWMDWNAEE